MKSSIVIAEDDPIIRMDILEILKEEGYNIIGEASDGIEAINLCKEKKPDILILDIKMPLVTGLQVSKVIKEEKLDICIIILTAYNVEEYIDIASKNQIMGYLLKPIKEGPFLSQLRLIYKNYEEKKFLKEEVNIERNKLKDRKAIEKAKGIVMETYNMTENEAYKKIRSFSMEKRISMLEISKIIVQTGEIL